MSGRRLGYAVFAGLTLTTLALVAQTPRDFAIDLYAVPSNSTPCLTLNWSIRRQGNITAQKIHRRLKGETVWVKLADLATNQTSYADATAVPGVEYEYWMERTYTGISPTIAMGYLSAGVDVPMTESRGKLLLVIDSTMVAPLAPEIEQLQADLTGEGWLVQTITALRSDTAANVKAQIVAAYNADSNNVKMVYLLGHVPVPYSGNMAPDGHADHVGAWPADGYYGEMNGTWTDTSVNNTSASRTQNDNVPGDGKFDQNYFPNFVELMVGRVDLHTMTRAPAAAVTETALLRRYLRRAHDFRMKRGAYADIPRRSMIRDGFGYFNGENFAIAGWGWAFTCVGQAPWAPIDEPLSGQWFLPAYAGGRDYLMACGNGGGSYESASTVGHTADFGIKPSRAVFTTLFGSYHGDWDSDNNFMRAVLAGNATGDSLGLTCFWGGRPNRFMHPMGMGETAAYGMWISQNSALAGGGGYQPNSYAGTHSALMGDPALRMYQVGPPRNLTVVSAGGQVVLAWSPSAETNHLGYHVYRAAAAAGPYARLTAEPLNVTGYVDAGVTVGSNYTYMVRTLKRESTPGGTFGNLSVGVPVSVTVSAGGTAVPGAPGTLNVAQNSSTNALLTWTDASDNETGFRIERKVNAGGAYTVIGAVGANVTNYTDTGGFAHGNVYYYRVVATNAVGDSLPSEFVSFDALAGFLDLPVTRMKVQKNAGAAVVTVNRFGGVTGPVSVNYTTADSSAVAGTHYAATSGVLTWADGESAAKTITVPVINTGAPQSARQFRVTLSAPSAGSALTVNNFAAVLIEDPTASLGAPWSQTIVGGITDSSAAVIEAGNICSVTIGGSGLTASSTTDSGQFVYQSWTGDGVLTAYFPAGVPADGNARYALMARASTGNNAIMAAAVTSSNTGFGTKLYSRAAAGAGSTETAANALVLARWVRLTRSGNTFAAETSPDGVTWTPVGTVTLASMPATAVWGVFHTSSDWSATALGNYHLAQAQNVTLTALPAPSVPTGLVATPVSSTSVALRWNPASFASGYRVERRGETNDYATIATVAASGTNQTYTNTGLDVNTAYAYRIVATNGVGESPPSAPAYAATAADMFVRVTTDGAGGADALVMRDPGGVPFGAQTNVSVSAYEPETYQLLTNATKSYLRFNLAGLGAVSSATLKLSLLNVREYDKFEYTALSIGLLGESSDDWIENAITWSNAPQNNLTSYGFNTPVVSLGSSYYFADDTTPSGTVIPFALSAANLNANRGANQLVTLGLYHSGGAYVDWASREHPDLPPPALELIVTTNVPPRASFLRAAPGTGWSIELAWQDNATNETGFVLERRVGDGAFETLQTFGANTTSYRDSDTLPGITYTYRVRAFNDAGPSDWTPEATITAATEASALSTVWDGGGADALFTTAANWDFNTVPPTNGTWALAFGTGGASAVLNADAFLRGLLFNRNADFALAAGGGALTLGDAGIRVALPSAVSRAYSIAAPVVLVSNQTWAITNNGAGVATLTVLGPISDGGSGARLAKTGNGVLVLAGDNSYSGPTVVQTGGVLRISHDRALGSADGATSVENGGWLEVSGGVTVAEPLTIAGDAALGYAGTLRSTGGSNVWTAPITYNGARIRVTSGSLDLTGGLYGPGGVFGADAGTVLRVSNAPASFGTGTVYMHLGGGTLVFAVAGNAWGTADFSGGTLRTDMPNALPPASILQFSTGTTFDLNGNSQTVAQLKNANANVGSRLITTAAPATLTVAQAADTYFNGVLAGALGLVKAGAGTLTLSNALNAMSGPVTVADGTLAVAPSTRLGLSTNVTVSGGMLSLLSAFALTNAAHLAIADGSARVSLGAGVTQAVERLYLGGVRKGRGTWGASGSGAVYVDDAHFAGAGVLLVLGGESTVWDAGGADAAFSTPENWDFDVLPFLDGTATIAFGAGGSVATLDMSASLAGVRFNRDADFTLAGGGALTLGTNGFWAQTPGTSPRAYAVAAPVMLAASQVWCVTNNGASATALTVSGAVADGGAAYGLTKTGDGTLVLAGSNTYGGATAVAAGGLRVAHGSALGGTNGSTSVSLGAWLEVGGGVAVSESLTLTADGTAGGGGNLRAADGDNRWDGLVTQTGSARVTAAAGSRLTLAGGLIGAYNLYLSPAAGGEIAVTKQPVNLGSTASTRYLYARGAGTVALGAAGNVFGTLEIAGGTVRMDAAGALPAATVLAIGSSFSTSGTLDLNGCDQTVSQLKRGISTAGERIVTSVAPATLTIDGGTTTPYDGALTGALSLRKAGSQGLTLSGAGNTYSGSTTVIAGSLVVGATATLGLSPVVDVQGGTLRLQNADAIADSATLRVAGGTGKVRVDSGAEIVGRLYLAGVRQGPGTYGSSASAADYRDNTFFDSAGLGVIVVEFCEPGTVWDGEGGADTRFSHPNNWDADWPPLTDGTAVVRFGTGGALATLDTDAVFSGVLFDRDADFALAAGGGVLTLGTNGFWVQAPGASPRAYAVAAPVMLAASQVWCVTNNGASATALTVSGAVADGGAAYGLTKTGDGTLVLAGSNTYGGATVVAAGGLRVAHGSALGGTNDSTSVSLGAWLEVGGGVEVGESLTLTADGTAGGGGNLRAADGDNLWRGRVSRTGIARITAAGGSRLTLGGGVTGAYNLYLSPAAGGEIAVAEQPLNLGSTASTRYLYAHGAGTVSLGAVGNVFGTLEVAGGTVRMEAAGALPAATILSIGGSYSPDGTFDLNGCDQTVSQLKRGISSAGARIVTSATPATLTVNGSTSTTFDGVFSGRLGLTKAGSSTLTLTGTGHTLSGAVTVSAGTLEVGGVSIAANLGTCPFVRVTGGTLRLRAAESLGGNTVVHISGTGKLRPDAGVQTVAALVLGGVQQPSGTYGNTSSAATYKSDVYFTAGTSITGVVHVLQGPGSVFSVR